MNNLTERTQKILNEIATWEEAKNKGISSREKYVSIQADVVLKKVEEMVNEDED